MKAPVVGLLGATLAFGSLSSEADDLPGQPVFFSGNDVHSACQRDKPRAQAYTTGLWDGTVRSAFVMDTTFRGLTPDAAVEFGLDRLGGFCAPGIITVEQVTDVFCGYLRETPGTRHMHAALLFSEAMKKVWPCKKP